jgi:MerR family mercuric resistance operon transcriptional regulator
MKRGTFENGLTIGKLAAQIGVNSETVRYYERIGLMTVSRRTSSGRRLYDDADERRLRFIRRSRELGFGLAEIKALLELASPHRRTCDEVRSIAERHLKDLRARVTDLLKLEAVLSESVARCATRGDPQSCPMLDALEAQA